MPLAHAPERGEPLADRRVPALGLAAEANPLTLFMHEASARLTAFEVLKAPVTILVGHFGAGKTEIAVNLAFGWRDRGAEVSVVDLDVVKPYFRSRLLRDEMQARGIALVVPGGDQFYADLPIVVPAVRGAVGLAVAGHRRVIMDVGGADVGARVLGSLPGLDDPALTDVLFVVNGSRPFAETPAAVTGMLREIEHASKLRVTGLIANTHLMEETTAEVVEAGLGLADAVARETGLPVRCSAILARLVDTAAAMGNHHGLPWLPLTRLITPPLELRPHGMRRRSSVV